MIWRYIVTFVVLLLLPEPGSAQALGEFDFDRAETEFTLTISRQHISHDCISGYLAVNGTISCYTLERPWSENAKNLSAIPDGEYRGLIRYDHDDHWRIELEGVLDRSNVQIHIGNNVDDSAGCILIGMELREDLCAIKGGTSRPAYAELKRLFYGSDDPDSCPNRVVTVEIVGLAEKSTPGERQDDDDFDEIFGNDDLGDESDSNIFDFN